MSWQPIATAPKDGMFDVWEAGIHNKRHCNVINAPDGDYPTYMTTARGYSGRGMLRAKQLGGEVTHWMPIPGAPE